MWKMVPTFTIFFHGFGWPPTLPLLLYKVCFSEFRCFFECFFVIWSWLLQNPVAIASTYLPINSQTFKSQSKMLCMQVFAWRNILYHFNWFSQHVTFSSFQKISENCKNQEKIIFRVRKKWVWHVTAESKRNYQKQWVLQVFTLPSILSLGLV